MPQIIGIPLTNVDNLSYYGSILVGNQHSEQHVSFDTTAHEIWIPTSDVHGIPDPYRRSGSTTFRNHPGTHANLRVRLIYNNIDFTATRRRERFYCNHIQDLSIRSTFCAIFNADPIDYYETTTWTGIVGLACTPPGHEYSPPIWQTMMNKNLLHANLFSLWMRDYRDAGDNGGQIMFGAMSVNHYNTTVGHVHYDVVEGCHEWMIHMSYVSVGQNQAMRTCNKALIHSASPYILGPSRIIRTINRQILGGLRRRRIQEQIRRGETPEDEDSPVFTDDEMDTNMPNVSFAFLDNDRVYTLGPDQYILEESPGIYTSVFRPMDFSDQNVSYFTLGTPFLRCYHSVFNFQARTISFAPSIP